MRFLSPRPEQRLTYEQKVMLNSITHRLEILLRDMRFVNLPTLTMRLGALTREVEEACLRSGSDSI